MLKTSVTILQAEIARIRGKLARPHDANADALLRRRLDWLQAQLSCR